MFVYTSRIVVVDLLVYFVFFFFLSLSISMKLSLLRSFERYTMRCFNGTNTLMCIVNNFKMYCCLWWRVIVCRFFSLIQVPITFKYALTHNSICLYFAIVFLLLSHSHTLQTVYIFNCVDFFSVQIYQFTVVSVQVKKT